MAREYIYKKQRCTLLDQAVCSRVESLPLRRGSGPIDLRTSSSIVHIIWHCETPNSCFPPMHVSTCCDRLTSKSRCGAGSCASPEWWPLHLLCELNQSMMRSFCFATILTAFLSLCTRTDLFHDLDNGHRVRAGEADGSPRAGSPNGWHHITIMSKIKCIRKRSLRRTSSKNF